MTFAKRLDYALKLRNKRPYELCRDTGLSSPQVSQYRSGKSTPKSDKLQLIADYLHVNTDFLLGLSDDIDGLNIYPYGDDVHQIPIYAPISCGTGGFVGDDVLDYIRIPTSQLKPFKRYFGQYAVGDSMTGAGIKDGDLLIFEMTHELNQGDIGCFCIDTNIATCKRFQRTSNKVYLVPANEAYQTIVVDPMEQHFVIVGKLASIIKFV